MSVATRLQAMQPTDVGVPGPTSWDMARAFRSIRADPLTFLGEVSQHYGDTVSFPVPGAPALLLNDPADVRHVLQTSARSWGKDTVQYAALARVTGPGLLASAEPSWIDHRRLAAPAFHHQRLEAVGDQVRAAARTAIAARLGGPHAAAVADGAVVDVAALTHTIGLDAVGRALFSTDLSDQAHDLLAATSEAADLVVRLGRSILPRAEWTPTRTNLRLRSARRRLDAGAAAIIAERRARNARAGGTPHHGDDLLGLLLDSGMGDGEIRDELVTMVIAGHETVAAALAWTLMLLAEHPQAQERVRSELDAHPGPGPARGAPRAPAVDARGRRRGAAPLPTGVGHLAPLAPRRRGRRAAGPGRHARHHQPLAGPPASRPLARARGLPSRALPRRHRPHGLPAVRPGTAAVHRAGVRARRDGRRPRRAAARAPHRRARRPGGWTRPVAEAKVAVHPRGGMPLLVRRTGTP